MAEGLDDESELPADLANGNFVLFVSTIEARKNHDLAFRVWRRLVDEMPGESVPILVFAGTVGWMVSDLMIRMSNTNFLEGKIQFVRSPTDAMLATLYRKCRFTIFPSLYEGWGLPVTESLSFGRTCIASSNTSVPEAGADFCIYIDPDNISGSYEIIRRAIDDGTLIESLENKIKANFKATPWSATAKAFMSEMNDFSDTNAQRTME